MPYRKEVQEAFRFICMSEFKHVKLLTKQYTDYDNVVGYCHCDTHRGYINKNILRKHNCLEKQCPFFKKHNDEYWNTREATEQSQHNKKQRIKMKKALEKERQKFEQRFFDQCKQIAQQIADDYQYDIIITRVAFNNNASLHCDYLINYVSDKKFDDFKMYFPLTSLLSREFQKSFKMRRIRMLDGSLAMKKDVLK